MGQVESLICCHSADKGDLNASLLKSTPKGGDARVSLPHGRTTDQALKNFSRDRGAHSSSKDSFTNSSDNFEGDTVLDAHSLRVNTLWAAKQAYAYTAPTRSESVGWDSSSRQPTQALFSPRTRGVVGYQSPPRSRTGDLQATENPAIMEEWRKGHATGQEDVRGSGVTNSAGTLRSSGISARVLNAQESASADHQYVSLGGSTIPYPKNPTQVEEARKALLAGIARDKENDVFAVQTSQQ